MKEAYEHHEIEQGRFAFVSWQIGTNGLGANGNHIRGTRHGGPLEHRRCDPCEMKTRAGRPQRRLFTRLTSRQQ